MSQCVPSWDLESINLNHDVFKLDYEVAELTWENGQLAMHELGPRRVPTKSHTTPSWDKPRAVETLEAIVNQATHQPYCKSNVVDELERVSWLNNKNPTTTAGSLNASAIMTSDALVPSNHKRTGDRSAQAHRSIKSAREGGCSTRVGSCSGNPSAFMDPGVANGGGGTTAAAHDWSSCRDVSASETFGTRDTYDYDLDARRLASTSPGSPENTSSVRDCSKSTLPDDSPCHCTAQREENAVLKDKKRGKAKSSISNKRRRTAAIHNQSERKRRDKINQKMTTLQKLVPNSNKTDKASMLDEVIDYVKQLQAQLQMVNKMNMSPMMMQLAMQQQMQMSMMNSMGMGMDMNSIGLSNIPSGFQPSPFIHMPSSWNTHVNDRLVNPTAIPANPMSAFFAYQSQPVNMDSNSRMAALYQHMQNQSLGPLRKN